MQWRKKDREDRYILRLEVPGIDASYKIQLSASVIPSKYLANSREKRTLRINGTSSTSVRTDLSIVVSQFQKKYFLRRSQEE
ncbi:MAG: hypothetical protein WCF23_11590 [Candidatus Nitrosopolaris sp.]